MGDETNEPGRRLEASNVHPRIWTHNTGFSLVPWYSCLNRVWMSIPSLEKRFLQRSRRFTGLVGPHSENPVFGPKRGGRGLLRFESYGFGHHQPVFPMKDGLNCAGTSMAVGNSAYKRRVTSHSPRDASVKPPPKLDRLADWLSHNTCQDISVTAVCQGRKAVHFACPSRRTLAPLVRHTWVSVTVFCCSHTPKVLTIV